MKVSAPVLPMAVATDDTRGRILVAALSLFAERGFHGTSIRDIAALAGLSSASLYSHFATKETILAELVLLGHEEHHRRLFSAMLESGPEPRAQLAAIMRAHVLVHAEFSLLGLVANTELRHLSASAAAPALALRRRSEEMVVEMLERGVRERALDVVDVAVTTRALGNMGAAVANWWPTWDRTLSAPELADVYATLVLRMVGVGPPV